MRGLWWRRIVLVGAGALAYSNSLGGPFLFDDNLAIVSNLGIRTWWDVAAIVFPVRESPVAGRPLVNLSFALNYAWGGLGVRGYHLGNLAIHLACALLIFAVIDRTLTLPRLQPTFGTTARDVAFVSALLWVLHPLNTEAVDYVVERTESLMALCYLLTLYASLRGLTGSARWGLLAILACGLGMACKESMVTAPLMVVLYDRVFAFASWRDAFRTRGRWYLGLAATWSVLALLVRSGPRMYSAGFSTRIPVWTYLLNQSLMLTRYLRLAVWPRGLVLFYGPPVPLNLGDVSGAVLLIVGLLILTIVALIWRPALGFLGAWFFGTLAPTSSLVPIATEVGAERRMYLPLIALVVLMVLGALQLWGLVRSHVRAADAHAHRLGVQLGAAIVIVAAGALALGTFQRNREYDSPLGMAQLILARWPTGAAHWLVGTEEARMGRHDAALHEYRQAVTTFPRAHYNIGSEFFTNGQSDEAVREFQMFVRDEPSLAEVIPAHLTIGRIWTLEQRWAEAVAQFRLVLSMTPSNVDAQFFLADALAGQQAYAEAIDHYQTYLRSRPDDRGALTALGLALVDSNRLEDALVVFQQAVALAPSDGQLRANLARAFLLHGSLEEATREARAAIAVDTANAADRDLLGRALALQGHVEEARTQYLRALQLDPHDAQAHDDLQRLSTVGATSAARAPG